MDGTERPVQRPRKSKSLRRKYSGKKKRHTRKNTVICNEKRKILVISPTKDGKFHDSRQLRKTPVIEHIPQDVGIWVDKAYTGIKNIAKNRNNVMIPYKKTRKKELSSEQKKGKSCDFRYKNGRGTRYRRYQTIQMHDRSFPQ